MMELMSHFNYWIYIILMMIGFYGVIAKQNLVKKIIGLGLFQTGIFLFYVSMGIVNNGTAPVFKNGLNSPDDYSHPLNHAIILTAIVVSVSTMAVALAIIINIHDAYGSIEADELEKAEHP